MSAANAVVSLDWLGIVEWDWVVRFTLLGLAFICWLIAFSILFFI